MSRELGGVPDEGVRKKTLRTEAAEVSVSEPHKCRVSLLAFHSLSQLLPSTLLPHVPDPNLACRVRPLRKG